MLTRLGSTLVLDVSASGQPHRLDWATAPPEARAVLCRSGEGQGSPDHMFAVHARTAAESGRMVGSYHVLEAHWAEVEEQAREYYETAYAATMLCPVLDVEETEASAHVELEVVAERAAEFAVRSSALWSRPGLLYTYVDYLARLTATPRGLAAMQRVRAAGWGLHIAAYRATDPAPRECAPWTGWRAWQFRNDIDVGGVAVDGSWFDGGERALASLGASTFDRSIVNI